MIIDPTLVAFMAIALAGAVALAVEEHRSLPSLATAPGGHAMRYRQAIDHAAAIPLDRLLGWLQELDAGEPIRIHRYGHPTREVVFDMVRRCESGNVYVTTYDGDEVVTFSTSDFARMRNGTGGLAWRPIVIHHESWPHPLYSTQRHLDRKDGRQ